VEPRYIPDRKLPIGYDICYSNEFPLHLVGAYADAVTAGCDTIRDVVQVFDLVRQRVKEGYDVIYEGLFVMNHTRGPQLAAELGEDMVVLHLLTPYTVCVSSINERRSVRGEGKLLSKKNTKGNWVRAENYCHKMREAGARVIKVPREKALVKLLEVLADG